MTTPAANDDVTYALVCLKTGLVLRFLASDGTARGAMADVASASPELFSVALDADWPALFARLGSEGGTAFREIVLVSREHVRVMERMPYETDVALVAVAVGNHNVGFVLSGVRRMVLELSASREPARGAG